jgi:hypothetical protein
MIVIYRGLGLFVLLMAMVAGAIIMLLPILLIPSAEEAHRYSTLAAFSAVVGMGAVCWIWGRYLKRRSGFSHSIYFLPIQFIGMVLVVVPALVVSIDFYYGDNPFFPKERTKKAAANETPATQPKPPSSSNGHIEDVVSHPHFKTEAEARQYALQRYPTLAIANSPFNTQFVELYKAYTATRPEIFKDPNWPLQLALETEQLLKSNPAPQAAVAKPGS